MSCGSLLSDECTKKRIQLLVTFLLIALLVPFLHHKQSDWLTPQARSSARTLPLPVPRRTPPLTRGSHRNLSGGSTSMSPVPCNPRPAHGMESWRGPLAPYLPRTLRLPAACSYLAASDGLRRRRPAQDRTVIYVFSAPHNFASRQRLRRSWTAPSDTLRVSQWQFRSVSFNYSQFLAIIRYLHQVNKCLCVPVSF